MWHHENAWSHENALRDAPASPTLAGMASTQPESPRFALPFESVRGLLLELAREQSLDPLLDLVVRRLNEHADVALARIWLVREGDICSTCPMRDECPGKVPCL